MNPRFKRYVWISAGTHVGVILLVIIFSLVSHVRKKQKPHEIITFIDMEAGLPSLPAEVPVVDELPDPTPPEPEPPPEPPKDIPEPPKEPPKPKKKKIEISKKRVKRGDLPPPKQKPKKKLSEAEIKKLLAAGIKPSNQARGSTTDFPFNWYLALVRQTMYEAWIQPSELSGNGLVSEVKIRVHRDGSISNRNLTRPSGNAVMDQSVMKAIRSVSRLKPLPDKFSGPYRDITIDFELTSGAGIL
jgi:protein TonB